MIELHRWAIDYSGESFRFQVWLLTKAFGKLNWPPVMTVEGNHIVMSIPCKHEATADDRA